MKEKSFVELERARETAIRCSPCILSRLEKLNEACKCLNISPAKKDAAQKITAALAAMRYGISSDDAVKHLIKTSKLWNDTLPSSDIFIKGE